MMIAAIIVGGQFPCEYTVRPNSPPQETITVTGETPIVDVQSAKVQQTVSKDIIMRRPV